MEEYFLNQTQNHECFRLPEKDDKYLLKKNFLSEFFSEDEKAEARFNLGITTLLNELKALVTARPTDDSGNVRFGLEPTNGEENEEAYNEVLSSATIYKALLKYYTKEELDGWMENLLTQFESFKLDLLITIDEGLDENSSNPVENKAVARAIKALNASYNRLASTLINRDELLNYYNTNEIQGFLQDLETTLKKYADTKDVDLSVYYTKEEINNLLSNSATNENIQLINSDIDSIELSISGISSNLETESGRIDTLETLIESNDSDIESLQQVIDSLGQTVSGHTQDINGINLDISSINQDITDINQDISTSNLSIETISQDITLIQGDILDINSDISDIQLDIEELKAAPKHVFLTQSEYDALVAYDDNTLYFILEDSEGSRFGDTFPLTFG